MNRIAKKIVTLAATAALALTSAAALAAAPLQLGVPDDGTNLSRGIKLLEAAGFIEVDPAAGYTPEIKDITKYLYNVEVTPIAANTLPSTLGDFAASTINGTYAVPYGLIPSRDALLIEKQDENGENPYVNVIVARTADKDNEVYKKVVEAYQTQLVAEFLLVNYHETFFPAFPYDESATFAVTEDNVSEISGYKSSKEGKTVVKIGVCGGVSNNEQWIATQKVLDDEGANIYIETQFVKVKGYWTSRFIIYGRPDPNGYTYKLDSQVVETIPLPDPTYEKDKTGEHVIYDDETQIKYKGREGYVVDVYLVTMDSNGLEISREKKYTDTYKAAAPIYYVGVTPRETLLPDTPSID